MSSIALAAPLSLSALGGYLSERSGVINIALEGNMLTSACVTYVVSMLTLNPWLGVFAGIGSAIVMALIHWLLTQIFSVDHVVSGMALNLIALGGTNFLGSVHYKFAPVSMPRLPRYSIDIGGEIVPISIYLVIAYLIPFAVAIYAFRTRGGIRLRSVGNDPSKARLAGISPAKVRFFAQCATGVLTGLSGALIVDNAGAFTDNMTAGQGYIALAALVIGSWRPIRAFVACLVFGVLEAVQIAFQGISFEGTVIPDQIWQSLPYVMAIIAAAGFVGRNRPPFGLGKP